MYGYESSPASSSGSRPPRQWRRPEEDPLRLRKRAEWTQAPDPLARLARLTPEHRFLVSRPRHAASPYYYFDRLPLDVVQLLLLPYYKSGAPPPSAEQQKRAKRAEDTMRSVSKPTRYAFDKSPSS